jgi:hypothetical protein
MFIIPFRDVIHMKKLVVLGVLVLLAIAAVPAQAFSADTLNITVQENGDATITFDYQLNWFEYVVIFLQIADPATQIQTALGSETGRTVVVHSVSPGRVSLDVKEFASLQGNDTGTTYLTPALPFTTAEQYLKGQWFSALVSADFSPAVTTVRFPDGYTQQFNNQDYIPAITHTVSR